MRIAAQSAGVWEAERRELRLEMEVVPTSCSCSIPVSASSSSSSSSAHRGSIGSGSRAGEEPSRFPLPLRPGRSRRQGLESDQRRVSRLKSETISRENEETNERDASDEQWRRAKSKTLSLSASSFFHLLSLSLSRSLPLTLCLFFVLFSFSQPPLEKESSRLGGHTGHPPPMNEDQLTQ